MKTINKIPLSILGLLIAAIVVLGSCGNSEQAEKKKQEKVDRFKVAQITWRDLSYIDTVKVGDTIIRDFVFYNTGWKPVRVNHAIPNRKECSCRVPSHDVEIGEQDTVRMTCIFTEPEQKVGVEVIVEHNTPQPSPTLLYITKVEEK